MTNLELNKASKMCLIVKAIITCCGLTRKDIAKKCGYSPSAVAMWLRTPYKNKNDIERSTHYLKATRDVYVDNLNMSQSVDTTLACSIFAKYVSYVGIWYPWDEGATIQFLEVGLKCIIYGQLRSNTTLPDTPINRLCFYILGPDDKEAKSYIFLDRKYGTEES